MHNGNGKKRWQIVYYVTQYKDFAKVLFTFTVSYSIISTRVTAISLTPYEKYGLQCGGRGEKKLESTNRNSFMLLCEV